MKNRIRIMMVLFTFVFALMAMQPAIMAADQPIKWRMAILYPRATEYAKVYLDFLNYIKVMSGGRLVVDAVFDGEGVPAPQMFGSIKSGLIEMGQPWMPLHAGEIPVGVIEAGLPGMPADYAALWGIYEKSGLKDVLRKAYGEQGVYWAAEIFQPACYAITKKEIKSLEDLKNMKLRALGAYGKMMREFGASPVSLAFGEVYTSLATGVVDGNVGSQITDFRDAKFYEVAKWFFPLPVAGYQAAPILVNMKAWNKLSDELKMIFEAACYRHAVDMRVYCLINERAAFKEMQAAGMKVSPMPSAEEQTRWFEAGRSVWDDYAAADKHSAEAIKVIRAFIQEYQIK